MTGLTLGLRGGIIGIIVGNYYLSFIEKHICYLNYPLKVETHNIQPIIKVVAGQYCNLRCDYCYERYSNVRLIKKYLSVKQSIKILDAFLCNLDAKEMIRLTFHGGEPLLRGIEYYHKIFNYVNSITNPTMIYKAIQTNGTLINQVWIDLFKEYDVKVGISIDGPRQFNDLFRRDKNNKSSFNNLMRNIELMIINKQDFSVICTITKFSLEPIILMDFFLSLGIKKVHFKPYVGLDLRYSISEKQLADFYFTLFLYLVKLDDPEIDVPTIRSIVVSFFGGNPSICHDSRNCLQNVTINTDGYIYPCDLLYNYVKPFGQLEDFKSGNWLKSDSYITFNEMVDSCFQKCKECELYERICYGGCTYYKYFSQQNDIFCLTRQKIFFLLKESFPVEYLE
jgi:uncharacterized protein